MDRLNFIATLRAETQWLIGYYRRFQFTTAGVPDYHLSYVLHQPYGGVTCDQGTRADVSGKKSTVNGKRGGRVCSIELVVFDQLNGCVDDSVLVQQTQPTPYPILSEGCVDTTDPPQTHSPSFLACCHRRLVAAGLELISHDLRSQSLVFLFSRTAFQTYSEFPSLLWIGVPRIWRWR